MVTTKSQPVLLPATLLGNGCPPVGDEPVERLLCRADTLEQIGSETGVHLVEKLRVKGHRPEILHYKEALIECFIVGSSVAESCRCQNPGVGGIATEIGPPLLRLVESQPLQEPSGFLMFG